MTPEADDQLRQLREAITTWRRRRDQGEWLEAAGDREQAYELLNELLNELLEGDQELLLLDREEATVLELLARETLERAGNAVGGGMGYGKLRRLIMNHPDWTFLPSKAEIDDLEKSSVSRSLKPR